MRVCIISNGYPLGSTDYVGAFARDFAHALKAQGHEVRIFTPDRKGKKEVDKQVPVTWFRWYGGDKPLVKLRFTNIKDLRAIFSLILSGRKAFFNYLKEFSPDVCLALWAAPSGLFAYWAKKKFDIPYAVWCLGSDIWIYARYPFTRQIIQRVLRKSDQLYADGLKLGSYVTKLCGGQTNFLPTSRKLPATQKQKQFVDNTKTSIVFIGRLEQVKGVDLLIEAVAQLRESDQVNQIRIYLFGVGTLESLIRKKVVNNDLGDIVIFKGFASAMDAATYLDQADWCIIPSRNESIPVVMSDALQQGTPLIVSDVGDMGLLVGQNKAGIVVRPNSVTAIKEAFSKILNMDRTSYLTYAKNAAMLHKQFNIKQAAEKFIKEIKQAVKQ